MKLGCCSELHQISILRGLILVEFAACMTAAKSPLEDVSGSSRAVVASSDTLWNCWSEWTYGLIWSRSCWTACVHTVCTSHSWPWHSLSLSSYRNQWSEWFGVATSNTLWYVQPVIATEAGPDQKCAKPFVVPIAVNKNRLFKRHEHAEMCRATLWFDIKLDMFVGRGGRGGTMHWPLLQQNVRSSPLSRRAPQYWQEWSHVGGSHWERDNDACIVCHHWFCSLFLSAASDLCFQMQSDLLAIYVSANIISSPCLSVIFEESTSPHWRTSCSWMNSRRVWIINWFFTSLLPPISICTSLCCPICKIILSPAISLSISFRTERHCDGR